MNQLTDHSNHRILVVDDNPAIHDDFRKILSAREDNRMDAADADLFGDSPAIAPAVHFDISSAYQGEEGLNMAREAEADGNPYAVAFVDVRMPPGWDGVETTAKLWELDPDLQIVLCTAYSDYSWGEMFEKLGQRDGLLILKKPFDSVEAFQLAHALTEKWRLLQKSRQKMEALEGLVAERTAELQRQQAELRVLFDLMPAKIWFKDTENNILRVNRRVAEALGKTVQEIEGKPFAELYPREAAGVHTDDLEVIRSGVPRLDCVEKVMDSEGRDTWIQTDKVPFCDGDGKVIGIVVMAQDITARKKIEAQLFESQKMETVGKLAGGVAHEFNNILTVIIGQSELIQNDLSPGHPLTRNVTMISKASERAATLTRQLIAYGRKTFLRPDTIDLNKVIANIENSIRHLMGGDVEVRIIPAEDLPPIKADSGQIEQVIINLAMNADDAMPGGGTLTLETENISLTQENSGENFPELKPGEYVRLRIADTGAGMTEPVKARAFEPFFTTKDVGRGSGLGLSTSYGIIKQSGGHISVQSKPGQGTIFEIYLPQTELREKPARQLDTDDLPHGSETILLVEDDPSLRETTTSLLSRLGYRVLPAANGIEALNLKQQYGTGHIDLLFTDVIIPHISGRELAERVQGASPQTRVLFTSAYTENAFSHLDVLNQGSALIRKPFTPSELANKLRDVLERT